MTWADFYDRFYDISESTRKSYAYKLTDYGPVDEVFEVLEEFAYSDETFAGRFAEKTLDHGVHYTPKQVLEIMGSIDRSVLSRMAESAVPAFDRDQLEELYGDIDDADFERISKKSNIDIFAFDEPDEPDEPIAQQEKKPGFFAALFGFIGMLSEPDNNRGRHSGRCDGDCAHCPPHYGYRYGRWYFGHDHQHGCEFGGNRGSGSRD